jgi:enterochelin esterase-like enzyme
MNDGQDFNALDLEKTLTTKFADKNTAPFIYVGIEANENRMKEYGTASSADYKDRGKRAKDYTKFILREFLPFLKQEYKVSEHAEDWVYCGMSLGGLTAFDIAYNNPAYFGKVGVFSGSFWWRKKAYVKKDLKDRSRIILDVIKEGGPRTHLNFWFQCGTEDESADRNNNGIIDAIDDTMDVIKELQLKGYTYPGDITYLEVEGGKHDLQTWARIFPQFIKWAFGQKTPFEKDYKRVAN